MSMTAEQVTALRKPFPPEMVGKLPKQVQKDDRDRGKCEPGSRYSADGSYCGGYHARSVHLDYVGHAAVTDRLLTVDHGRGSPSRSTNTGYPPTRAETCGSSSRSAGRPASVSGTGSR